jgi:hypothetical protein
MTTDDIMKLARKAGLYTHKDVQPEILAFAHLVAAHKAEVITAEAYRCGILAGAEAEREACAKVCEDEEELQGHTPFDCALRIRARGENT